MTVPDLPPLLEDPTGFPDGATAEVERRPRPEPSGSPLDARRFGLLALLLVALFAGSVFFLA